MKNYDELYEWFRKDIMKPAVIRNGDKTETVVRIPYSDERTSIQLQV